MNFTLTNLQKMIAIVVLWVVVFTTAAIGSPLDKAKLLRLHGLAPEAKKELIDIIYSKQKASAKAEAYYILGSMAFEQNQISAALETWTQLVTDFPNSDQAKLVKDRINQLSEIIGETSRTVVENAVAQSYLRHAKFWSEDEMRKKFTIESSLISNVSVAVSWYDKVIAEFPNTEASRQAYEDKMKTLIGKIQILIDKKADELKEYKYESVRAIVKEQFANEFNRYMPKLLETFSAYERDYPEMAYLQTVRFQIGQIYLFQSDLDQSRLWLNRVIEHSGETNTFYRDLAERRLETLEAFDVLYRSVLGEKVKK